MTRAFSTVVALLALLIAHPAVGGTLYRCKGSNGETAFTSSRAGYRDCRAVRTFEDTPNTAPAIATDAAAAAPKPSVDFRTSKTAEPPQPAEDAPTPSRSQSGAVYKYVKDGVTHYTNRRPSGVQAAVVFTYIENCYACTVRSGVDFQTVRLNTNAFAKEIDDAANEHDVDPAFVRAIIHAESAFNPNALSNKGAQGLMQLMPATAERFGVDDAFVPAQNIKGGVRYLAWLLKRFKGNTKLVAAAYNSGEGSVDRYGGVPPFDETLVFVERVGTLHGRYRTSLASAAGAAGSASVR